MLDSTPSVTIRPGAGAGLHGKSSVVGSRRAKTGGPLSAGVVPSPLLGSEQVPGERVLALKVEDHGRVRALFLSQSRRCLLILGVSQKAPRRGLTQLEQCRISRSQHRGALGLWRLPHSLPAPAPPGQACLRAAGQVLFFSFVSF